MKILAPPTREEFVDTLTGLAARGQTILLEGNSSKERFGGPLPESDLRLSTRRLNRVLRYQPEDLTISVEAGMLWTELTKLLAEHNQMLPLDPPYAELGTVGGVLAADCSGPRRRGYGTARDLLIGMEYATTEGRIVQSGGMVVKNVAGLDTAKLLIGSFGTLAAILVANFKVMPRPPVTATLLLSVESGAAAVALRNRVQASAWQQAALEILNPAVAARMGLEGWTVAIQASGNEAAVARCRRELDAPLVVEGEGEGVFWRSVQEFSARWMDAHPAGGVVRVSATLQQMAKLVADSDYPALFRAGSGLAYYHFDDAERAAGWLGELCRKGWKGVVEAAALEAKARIVLWPEPGDDFAVMQKIKKLFDPKNLLNPGRLYGRI